MSADGIARTRVSARQSDVDVVTGVELARLRLKAQVCDAYRAWLDTPTQRERSVVCAALARLAEFECKQRL